MATNQTEHYSLNQWELSDSVIMAEFNEDNQKIDAALSALSNKVDDSVTQILSAVPHLFTGSYVGTGTYGEEHPNTLTFDFSPKMLIFVDTAWEEYAKGSLSYTVFAMYPSTFAPWSGDNNNSTGVGVGRMRVIWGDHSISWYADFLIADNSAGYHASVGPTFQHNAAGTTYHYIAIG